MFPLTSGGETATRRSPDGCVWEVGVMDEDDKEEGGGRGRGTNVDEDYKEEKKEAHEGE